MKRFFARIFYSGLACSLVVCSGCSTVSMPNAGQPGYTLQDDERRLMRRSDEMAEKLDERSDIYPDKELDEYLSQLANALLTAQEREAGVQLQVKVIRDPTFNAFALANGRIYVHLGILAAAENEAQIATLLGHELSHVTNRHVLKEMHSVANKTAFYSALMMPLAAVGGELALVTAQLGTMSSISGFSKEMEYEADECGFRRISAAGDDPFEGVKLFEHMKTFVSDEEIKAPFFFSTHPALEARVKNFRDLIAKQGKGMVSKDSAGDRYPAFRHDLLLAQIQLCLRAGYFRTAEKTIGDFIAAFAQEPSGYFYRGELFRQRQDLSRSKKDREDKPGDYQEALKAYEEALSRDADFAPALAGKGQVLRKLGRTEEAKKAFAAYLTLNPQAPDREYVEQYLREQ